MEIGAVSAVLATGVAAGGALLALAWNADDRLSKELREDLRLWLLRVEPERVDKSLQRWPTHFAALFDRVFGEKHLSWRCFFRSCALSMLALLLCSVTFSQVAAEDWTALYDGANLGTRLLQIACGAVLLNFLADYVSLLETRFIVRKLQTVRSIVSRVAWLLADFVATLCIFALLFVVVFKWPIGEGLGFWVRLFSTTPESLSTSSQTLPCSVEARTLHTVS